MTKEEEIIAAKDEKAIMAEFRTTMCKPREDDGELMIYDPSAQSIEAFLSQSLASYKHHLEQSFAEKLKAYVEANRHKIERMDRPVFDAVLEITK